MATDLEEDELRKTIDGLMVTIHDLNRLVWENKLTAPVIDQWLAGFGPDALAASSGRVQALYLLSRFMYFGSHEIRGLLRSLHREHFRYPIVSEIRRAASDTSDELFLADLFNIALGKTRFLGIGNPSESGSHLLYLYRQVNGLSRDLFVETHAIFDLKHGAGGPAIADPSVVRYVFLDDFCGTGEQAVKYSNTLLTGIKAAAAVSGLAVDIEYHVMVGNDAAIDNVRKNTLFDRVTCALELDASYQSLERSSRYFHHTGGHIDRGRARALAALYGAMLNARHPLGFDNCQLLLGFHHNTPDNTLPIFWHGGTAGLPWNPVFRRYPKVG